MADLLDCLTKGSNNLPIPKNLSKSLSIENIVLGCALAGLTYVAGNALFGKKSTEKLLGDQLGNLFK